MNFQILIANLIIDISCHYGATHFLCKDYIFTSLNRTPDIYISLTYDEIKEEYNKNDIEYIRPSDPNHDPDTAYVETLAIYRKIAEAALDFNTFLMHGSVISINGKAHMFIAPSGTGKTTITNLILNNFQDAYIINGDKPLIQINNSSKKVLACGTPWCGKEGFNKNTIQPLQAIYILERGDETSIEEISFSSAFTELLKQTYKPNDGIKMQKTLNLLKQIQEIKFYKLKLKYYSDINQLVSIPDSLLHCLNRNNNT